MTELKSTVTKPRPRQDIINSEEMIGKQLFLYAGDDGDEIHCLNGGAAIIWLLCVVSTSMHLSYLQPTQRVHNGINRHNCLKRRRLND